MIPVRSAALVSIITVSSLLGSPAQGEGYGAYFDYANANATIDLDLAGFPEFNRDYDTERFGFGFAADSNLAADRLLNYRFQIGYQYSNRKIDRYSPKIDSHGITTSLVFGFAPIRTRHVRPWFGPSFRINVDIFDHDDIKPLDRWIAIGAGLGPAAGFNWHLGERLSASLLFSYQYMFLGHVVDFDGDQKVDDGTEHLVTLGISIFFRTPDDQFRPD